MTPIRPLFPAAGLLGWREWVALPAFGIPRIKAKIDTGARTSSIHAYGIETFRRHGERWVRFKLHPFQGDLVTVIHVEAPLLAERRVRTSGGHESLRPVILTEVEVLGRSWPIELTLNTRDQMGFRMLLGREALNKGRFLVDPSRSYVAGRFRRLVSRRKES